MDINLKNKELIASKKLLEQMKLKASDSRHRTKFVKLLDEAIKQLSESELELVREFAQKNEQGEPEIKNDGSFDLVKETSRNFHEERNKLFEEVVVIKAGMFEKNVEELPRILAEYDALLESEEAEIYDRLADEFGI